MLRGFFFCPLRAQHSCTLRFSASFELRPGVDRLTDGSPCCPPSAVSRAAVVSFPGNPFSALPTPVPHTCPLPFRFCAITGKQSPASRSTALPFRVPKRRNSAPRKRQAVSAFRSPRRASRPRQVHAAFSPRQSALRPPLAQMRLVFRRPKPDPSPKSRAPPVLSLPCAVPAPSAEHPHHQRRDGKRHFFPPAPPVFFRKRASPRRTAAACGDRCFPFFPLPTPGHRPFHDADPEHAFFQKVN